MSDCKHGISNEAEIKCGYCHPPKYFDDREEVEALRAELAALRRTVGQLELQEQTVSATLGRELAEARALLARVIQRLEVSHLGGTGEDWRHNICEWCDDLDTARAFLRRSEEKP